MIEVCARPWYDIACEVGVWLNRKRQVRHAAGMHQKQATSHCERGVGVGGCGPTVILASL